MKHDVSNVFRSDVEVDRFDQVRISIASPEKIRSWSYGIIKKPETINYRTLKPEKEGLFCAQIFGPTHDYECLCGKYKRMKFKGIICEKCNVEVTIARVRRERMAHIELAAPVAHIWFLKSLPSRIGLILDMTLKDLERVLYFENYIVVEPGFTELRQRQLLSEEDLAQAQQEFGEESFTAMIGAEALYEILCGLDLQKMRDQLLREFEDTNSEAISKKLLKRLKLVEAFLQSGNRPEWMIMTVVPVIPPDLRPLVPLDGGRFATSDLNDLYRRVINRNNRLARLLELEAPDIIIRNEKRMLQEAVDALFNNGRRGRVISGSNKRPLKSLSDMLKGKQGRFRQNLLGKRVDYSGRSVIVVGPELKLHQCGLPKKMALELFKPFIYSKLEALGHSSTIRQAKRLVEKERPEVWDILDDVIREHPILLNRAPTLHRLGIQAFEPVLVEGKAIHLHPLVCSAFNADFDGDTMSVHVPLSLEAQLEVRVLMMSTNNILYPANGMPIIVPSKDIVLGLYYLSLELDNQPGEGMSFSSIEEVKVALDVGAVTLHSKVKVRLEGINENGEKVKKIYVTTPGRVLISEYLPKKPGIYFSICNKLMTISNISMMIDRVYRHCGQKDTVVFSDKIMALGFENSARSGVSVGKDDMVIPNSKAEIVEKASVQVKELEQQYSNGLITQQEKYNKVVDVWSKCTDNIADRMMKRISSRSYEEDGREKPLNSIYMMSHSGARGSPGQIKQLAGMRGLMAKTTGEIIEIPIISNFKEGLSVLEYFNSTHGARKGMVDLALKTANSGYLTRRLVDVAQDSIITIGECGSKGYIGIQAAREAGHVVASLGQRVLGRVVALDVVSPKTEKVIIPCNTLLEEKHIIQLEDHGVQSLKIRSVLTCEAKVGLCAMCYGRDLARGKLVNIGEAVGVVAAQSIGEPGTQLTMRTFHVGGTALVVDRSFVDSSADGTVKIRNREVIRNSKGKLIVSGRTLSILILGEDGSQRHSARVPYGAELLVDDGDTVVANTRLAEWDGYSRPIISEVGGIVNYEDLVRGQSLDEVTDEVTGMIKRVVKDWRGGVGQAGLRPALIVGDEAGTIKKLRRGGDARYSLSANVIIACTPGQKIEPGDVLARVPTESAKTRDITGGLPRVAELFEARKPKDHAVMAQASGIVRFGKDYKSKRCILIERDGEDPVEIFIPKNRPFYLQEGDLVEKGDFIVDGKPAPHDILEINGVESMAAYLVNEIQEVYRMQGVLINDKHIEVVVRQMLQKVEVTSSGGSILSVGEQIDRYDWRDMNEKLQAQGLDLIGAKPVLLGITKASLRTRSFISAASFQETTRVLTEAALLGKTDKLEGLKESVIVGKLVPVGTGTAINIMQNIADKRDKLIVEQKDRNKSKIDRVALPSGSGDNVGIDQKN